jgi:tetratricopeptide (TPR) repeat protein
VDTARIEALAVFAEAERWLSHSAVLKIVRQRYEAARRSGDSQRQNPPPLPPVPPRRGEQWAWGRLLLASGDLQGAAQALELAVQEQPLAFWPGFYLGLCRARQGRHLEAAHAFSVSIGRAPDRGECYYFRGEAYVALNMLEQALHDYRLALQLRKDLGPAWLQRGLLLVRSGRAAEAMADLRQALIHGADPGAAHLGLAQAQSSLGQVEAARGSLREVLKHTPDHPEALALLARLEGRSR